MNLVARAHYDFFDRDRVRILLGERRLHGGWERVVAPVVLTVVPYDENDLSVQPTLELSFDTARSLLDALLAAGITPSKPIPETQLLDAVRAHLASALRDKDRLLDHVLKPS